MSLSVCQRISSSLIFPFFIEPPTQQMGESIVVSGTKKPAPKESTGLTATGSFNAGFAAPLRVAD